MKKIWFFLLCVANCRGENFSFTALTPEDLKTIMDYQQAHPYGRFTINITGQPGLRNTWNYYVQNTAQFLYNISPQNIVLKGFASLFGMTMLSYVVIAYFIYCVYDLISKIRSWLSWNKEVHSHDMISEAQQYLKKTQCQLEDDAQHALITRSKKISPDLCLEKIKKEEKMLRLYMKLNTLLKNKHIRFLFDYDEEKENQIAYALSLLHEAASLNEKRDEHYA